MKNRNIADIGVVLYIFLLIFIGLHVGAPSSYAPRAAQPEPQLVATTSGSRMYAPEK